MWSTHVYFGLILASKYIQDRNYSARAWSKITGLGVSEINQNELAFAAAVDWRFHFHQDLFKRWTATVLRLVPKRLSQNFDNPDLMRALKQVIRRLKSDLSNSEDIIILPPEQEAGPYYFLPVESAVADRSTFGYGFNESTPTPKYYTPNITEPSPNCAYPLSKPAPAPGLLPTPRLTPRNAGFNTPVVSTASYMLHKSSMGYAIACASQMTDRWQTSLPQTYYQCRSSLANSVSSMSSIGQKRHREEDEVKSEYASSMDHLRQEIHENEGDVRTKVPRIPDQ